MIKIRTVCIIIFIFILFVPKVYAQYPTSTPEFIEIIDFGFLLGAPSAPASPSSPQLTWTNSGGDRLASNKSNWSSGIIPQDGDSIVFNSTSTNNCNWDLTVTLNDFEIMSGYTGSVDLTGDRLSIAQNHFWTGNGINNYATTPENWSDDTLPEDGDNIIFNGASSNDCIWNLNIEPSLFSMNSTFSKTVSLDSNILINGNLTIAGGVFDLNNKNLTTAGYLLIGVDGELNATSSVIEVAGDWANGGEFSSGTSTVILTGTNQTIYGNTTFYNLKKTVTSEDTLYFQAGSTQTVINSLSLQGDKYFTQEHNGTTEWGDWSGGKFFSVGDYDGDGDTDWSWYNSNDDDFIVMLSNGDGHFTPKSTKPSGLDNFENGKFFSVDDYDGDGDTDWSWYSPDNDDFIVMLSNGDGYFSPVTNDTTEWGDWSGGHFFSVGDYDGDGDTDWSWYASDSDNFIVMLSNGDGTYLSVTNDTTGWGDWSGGHFFSVGDYDGDLDTDWSWYNSNDDQFIVMLSTADGHYDPKTNDTYGWGNWSGGHFFSVGDYDGDLDTDWSWYNSNDDQFIVMLSTADGHYDPKTNDTYGWGDWSGGKFFSVGDYDEDGNTDWSWYSPGNDDFIVMLSNGNGSFSPVSSNTRAWGNWSGGHFFSVGDYDGDGDTDWSWYAPWTDDFIVMLSKGANGNLLYLRSTEEGSYWFIDPQGTRNISYVNLQDLNNLNFVNIVSLNSQNAGHNEGLTLGGSLCVAE